MKIYNVSQFEKEDNENYNKYKEAISRYGINRIFYIEDKYDVMSYDYIETDDTRLKVSKSLISILPTKKYFTLILTSKSRSNVNEPYFFYKIETLDTLYIEILKEKGEIVFENYGNEEDNYAKQESKLNKEELLKQIDNESNETLKTLIEEDDSDEDEEYYEEGDE